MGKIFRLVYTSMDVYTGTPVYTSTKESAMTTFFGKKILLQKWPAYEQNLGQFFGEKIQKNPTCQVLRAVQNPATSNVIRTSDSGR